MSRYNFFHQPIITSVLQHNFFYTKDDQNASERLQWGRPARSPFKATKEDVKTHLWTKFERYPCKRISEVERTRFLSLSILGRLPRTISRTERRSGSLSKYKNQQECWTPMTSSRESMNPKIFFYRRKTQESAQDQRNAALFHKKEQATEMRSRNRNVESLTKTQ